MTGTGKPVREEKLAGVTFMEYRTEYGTLYVAHSGPGEIAAAAATALLIGHYGAELIINFGVVGGLTPEMALAKTAVVEGVVHYDFDAHQIGWGELGQYPDFPDRLVPTSPGLVAKAIEIQPELKAVVCASADKFVDEPDKKRFLNPQLRRAYMRHGNGGRCHHGGTRRRPLPYYQNRLRRRGRRRGGIREGAWPRICDLHRHCG